MPRTLKRRSEAISGNNDDNNNDIEPSESPEPPTQRRRRHSSSASSSASPDPETQSHVQSASNTQTLVKKLVRLALSAEYARLPLRRSDIAQKILKDNNASHREFKAVFAGAQRTLAHVFGMTLVELPGREKTALKDRRAQATQAATQSTKSQAAAGGSSSNRAWILVSTLPSPLKQDPRVCVPARASSCESEAEYAALYTFVLSLIYLNGSVLTDAKLERYLKRVNADTYTPAGATDKLLQRMVKEGYIDRRRDASSGEEVVEWVVGPRGKIEVGVKGIANLVKGVYGFGKKEADTNNDERENGEEEDGNVNHVKIEEEELDRRLERSLGIKMTDINVESQRQSPSHMEVDGAQELAERPRRGRPRKNNDVESDDD